MIPDSFPRDSDNPQVDHDYGGILVLPALYYIILISLTLVWLLFSLIISAYHQISGLDQWRRWGDPPPLSETLSMVSVVDQRQQVVGYRREDFGHGWATYSGGETTRELILAEDARFSAIGGTLMHDPYSGEDITPDTAEIDHIIPLSAAWDLGAFSWTDSRRQEFANDPINLVAVLRSENREKSDSLPSEWMPSMKKSRCWYSRKVALVAQKYELPLPRPDIRTMRRACWLAG